MPLNCDCFPGCWGRHSEGWPSISFQTEAEQKVARNWIIDKSNGIPYGSYVVVGNSIRFEKEAYKRMVEMALGYYEAAEPKMQKWVPTTDPGELRLLGKASEEAGELVTVLARCIIQGLAGKDPRTGKDNRMWLEEEIADVEAACDMLKHELGLDIKGIAERAVVKRARLKEWRDLLNG